MADSIWDPDMPHEGYEEIRKLYVNVITEGRDQRVKVMNAPRLGGSENGGSQVGEMPQFLTN